MTLAERIRTCAEIAGSANELARKTGVPRSTLETYLSGLAEPKAERLATICRITGVNGHWLLTGEGEQLIRQAPRQAGTPQINKEALVKVFEVMMYTAEAGETPKDTSRKAVDYYLYLLETGKITLDGVGDGNLNKAA